MITYNTIIYDIKETLASHKIVDDFNVDDRRIMYLFNIQRSLWLKREYNTPGRSINVQLLQSICLDLELKSANACPCDTIEGCDEFLVSTVELPQLIDLNDKPALVKIGSPDLKNYFFSFVPYAQSVYSGSGRFNNRSIFAFILNNKIYIPIKAKEHKLIEKINVVGIFEDPSELKNFFDCNTQQQCFDKDKPYPVPLNIVPFIKEMVLKELLLNLPKDNVNDSNNLIPQPTK